MWTCPVCHEDVDDDFEVCWSCGSTREGIKDPDFDPEREGIMDERRFRREQAAQQHQDAVTVATFWNAPEAYMVRARLEAEGIRAYVADELATMVTWGLLNNSGGVKLQVAEKDAERAREVLARIQHTNAPPEEKAEPGPGSEGEGIMGEPTYWAQQRPKAPDDS
jgi:hypothetical protein